MIDSYSRVTQFYVSPGGWPVMFLGVALLMDGIGILFAYDVARKVPLFANPVAIFGLVHASVCIMTSLLLLIVRLSWRVEHQGLVIVLPAIGFGYLMLSSYFGIMLVSDISTAIRLTMLFLLVFLHGYFAVRIARFYISIWKEENLRSVVFVEYESHFLYSLHGDKYLREKFSIAFIPSVALSVSGFILGFLAYILRVEVHEVFGVSWVPAALAVWGLTFGAIATSVVTAAIFLYFVFPFLLYRRSAKPVYIDLVSPVRLS
jgi:hypothetical protein